jgi:hypothetical protein
MEMDLSALDLIAVQRRWSSLGRKAENKEVRRIVEISEVLQNAGGAQLNCLFGFDYRKGVLEKRGESLRIMEKACRCFRLGRAEIVKELKRRQILLERMACSGMKMGEFFGSVAGLAENSALGGHGLRRSARKRGANC